MATHTQSWVKVNTEVDEKLVDAIAVLNRVEGLQTLQSCQGEPGERQGYIYFSFGEWQTLCRFVFNDVAPHLKNLLGEDVRLEVIAGDGKPFAKMSFSAEAIERVTAALKEVAKV